MVEISDKIKETIDLFFIESRKNNINIVKAVLFGSYGRGTQQQYSDIDLAVVSPDFSGIRYYDLEKVRKAKLKAGSLLEIHTFKPKDFTNENPFVSEILSTGISII